MNRIKSMIEMVDSILVLTHINPDGDALGSSLSMYNMLVSKGCNADIMVINAPLTFSFLPNYDKIITTSSKDYDLVIVVDTATLDRIGQDAHYFENAKYTINIDHHKSNTNYANYNYVLGNSPACCEYLYEIYNKLGIEIDKDIATCLICGILTDTGGFQYSEVNYKTFDIASHLSKIVDIPMIYKKVLGTRTKAQFELSKIASSRLEFYDNDKVCFTYLLQEDLYSCNASNSDHEGIVNIGRDIEGVEASIFLREQDGMYRVSLRGNGNIDLSEVSKLFGGGGHKNAAGITLKKEMSFEELKNKLIDAVINELNNG